MSFESLLYWASGAEKSWKVLHFLRIPQLATRLLARRKGVVKTGGLQFFPDRLSLHLDHGSLAARFANVSAVSAMLVVGDRFYDVGENIAVVKELLLPNPEGEALKYLLRTVGREYAKDRIREVTNIAKKAGAKVKWYDNFVFHSLILVDVDKPSGWMHVEMVLPYSKIEKRPSFTIYKKQSEMTVSEMTRIFREIWDSSTWAPDNPLV
jgi:hypothetical protein